MAASAGRDCFQVSAWVRAGELGSTHNVAPLSGIAAVEVMVNNVRIAELIREDKTEQIVEAIEEGSFFDMQTFTKSLIELVVSGAVSREVAADASTNRHDFLVTLERSLKQQAADVMQAAEEASRPEPNELGVPELRIVQPHEG